MNRGIEISPEVADGLQSAITEQVTNGVAVRMALLYLLIGGRPDENDNQKWLGSGSAGRECGHKDILVVGGKIAEMGANLPLGGAG